MNQEENETHCLVSSTTPTHTLAAISYAEMKDARLACVDLLVEPAYELVDFSIGCVRNRFAAVLTRTARILRC